MTIKLAERLDRLPPYLFAQIDAARERAAAKGLRTVSMGIGDPDRDPPQWVREILAEEVMREGSHRYPSYKGHPRLHEAALKYLQRSFGVGGLGDANVMTTIGSKEGIANLVTALVNPGDVIAMPDPMYPVFGTMSRLHGAETVSLPVHPSTHFMPDPRQYLSAEQEAKLRVLFINYPHNPTGQIATREYLQGLVDYARERGVVIVSDMAYGEIFFDAARKPDSILALDGALDCAIEMHSFSKSFNMTGWRVGFAVGNAQLIGGLLQVKSNIDSGCFNAIQLAMARVLDDPRCDPFLNENRAHYKLRMEKVVDALEGMGIKVHRPGASIFVWCEVPGGQPSIEWCSRLLDETGLVVSPGAAYGAYGEGFFRVSLSTPDEDIDTALNKLREFVSG
ncbi:MAG: aminotransferase class I/II-fold pyridoxal phosphate-dependent enzyme [bacterium]|nr:aminotransferase class I/II-fold pyridoxal phosphate-dependent enzyme [bacterium]